MGPIWKCSLRSLKENRRRTIVTIIGVALATALITAVACMGTSFLRSEAEYLKKEGDYHARFTAVSKDDLKYFENNQAIQSFLCVKRNGYGVFQLKKNKPVTYLEMLAPEPTFYERCNVILTKGRFPEREGEIILSKEMLRQNSYDYKVGDQIQLSIGDRVFGDQLLELGTSAILAKRQGDEEETLKIREVKTFTIVGTFRGGQSSFLMGMQSGYSKPVYKAYYYDETPGEFLDVYVKYTKAGLANHEEVDSALLGISPELLRKVYESGKYVSEEERWQATRRAKDYSFNTLLAGMEYPRLIMKYYFASLGTFGLIYLLVIYAGVFCINNSFDLSFTERIRYYGLLSTIGMTKRQKRKLIWTEALYVGGIGIPAGICLGCLFTGFMVSFVNFAIKLLMKNIGFRLFYQISFAGIGVSAALAFLMVFLSAMESAVRASKIMPLSAIRLNDFVKNDKKAGKGKQKPKSEKRAKSHFAGKIFGPCGKVAFLNFKRSKLKYRATVTSIALSVALLVGISFIKMVFEANRQEMEESFDSKWQLEIYSSDGREGKYEELMKIASLPGITKSLICSVAHSHAKEGSIPYLDGKNSDFPDSLCLVAVDENSFAELCRQAGIDPKDAKGKGIVDTLVTVRKKGQNGKPYSVTEPIADLSGVHEISMMAYVQGEEKIEEAEFTIPIAGQFDGADVGALQDRQVITIYVSMDWREQHDEVLFADLRAYFCHEDVSAFENMIDDLEISGITVTNIDEIYQSHRFSRTLILFLTVGFILIIFLIGVTNVINTVSTNMELRSSEYAKLKTLGMTEGQFRKMVDLEGFYVAGKGLAMGLLSGYAVSYALYRFFWEVNDKRFMFTWKVPILETAIALFVVAITMASVLRYCRKRFSKKNLIETIRGENV